VKLSHRLSEALAELFMTEVHIALRQCAESRCERFP
jgi:hypothetical protein